MGSTRQYATGCAFNIKHLFMNFPYKKLKLNCKQCEEINGDRHRDVLVKQIFRDSVNMVLNDIIDNNVTFQLPLNGSVKCDMHMNRVTGEDFQNLRRAGKWQDVDFLKSMFSAYQMVLTMQGNRTPRTKKVYVGKEMRDRITKNTNDGKQYC